MVFGCDLTPGPHVRTDPSNVLVRGLTNLGPRPLDTCRPGSTGSAVSSSSAFGEMQDEDTDGDKNENENKFSKINREFECQKISDMQKDDNSTENIEAARQNKEDSCKRLPEEAQMTDKHVPCMPGAHSRPKVSVGQKTFEDGIDVFSSFSSLSPPIATGISYKLSTDCHPPATSVIAASFAVTGTSTNSVIDPERRSSSGLEPNASACTAFDSMTSDEASPPLNEFYSPQTSAAALSIRKDDTNLYFDPARQQNDGQIAVPISTKFMPSTTNCSNSLMDGVIGANQSDHDMSDGRGKQTLGDLGLSDYMTYDEARSCLQARQSSVSGLTDGALKLAGIRKCWYLFIKIVG
ncbi:unnamed protein product [Protopolystoma xenopodis]|uniref:Uncharacterized protein n=1 Tax=Protopolystoma xenopodis TaxID=117903 RepID=A0A3S5CGT5_9PLAT|nr:unnamed protein product [Protopolystoma xenopodis]